MGPVGSDFVPTSTTATGTTGAVAGGCAAGQTLCGDTCVFLDQNGSHCGACFAACAPGSVCQAGVCSCSGGLSDCGGVCTDTTSDVAQCGACGNACSSGQSCQASVCSCLAGLSDCAGTCTDVNADALNCGGCGVACAAAQVCSLGQCSDSCAAGLTQCGQDCVDVQTSTANCGVCGMACPAGQECSAGTCGCPQGQTACGTQCVQTSTDPNNCGACGEVCSGGQTCSAGSCACPTAGETFCSSAGSCIDTDSDPAHCGACDNACASGVCTAGQCEVVTTTTGTGGAGGSSGTGGSTTDGTGGTAGNGGTAGAGGGAGNGGSAGAGGTGGAGGSSGDGGTGNTGGCDAGSSQTDWATNCADTAVSCTAGSWSSWGSSSPENYPLRYETEHFAFLWPDGRAVSMSDAQAAGDFLENVLWPTYMGSPINWPEPYCDTSNKLKTSIHIIESGLYGGCNNGRPGIWVGPGALADHWGLGHEWMHALQCMSPGFPDCGAGGCWIHESHANFMPHQLAEYRDEVHCSEMLMNAPHLYYGSTRDRYCNWQFFEFLKDKYCHQAVNEMWTEPSPGGGLGDPWNKLANNMGWSAEDLNDEFGEWAMHNVTWDYQNPDGSNQGSVYRGSYGAITDTSRPERRLRVTRLESLDDQWASNRRFVSPYYWAPQRWGYNVVRLFPEGGASQVTVSFRGVTQSGANSGWRWGLLATNSGLTTARYSQLMSGADGELSFCINSGESLWLVVMAAPTSIQKIIWDQAYPSIYRYPYMVQVAGAWPEGFQDGQLAPCASGERHENGGGCAPANLSTSVYVGPYAQVLGGNVSGDARIEDHAVILNGATVSGGTVGAMSILNRFTVSGSATVQTTFYPPGFFESGQGLSGSARLYGDVEYRGQGLNKSSGSYYGFVDSGTSSQSINDVTVAPPYTWRP